MTATYITIGLSAWAIVCMFAVAFNRGAHRPPKELEQS